MTTFQSHIPLDKPTGSDPLSERTLTYVSHSAREEVFDTITRECIEAGITNKQLAKRMRRTPAQISRLLGAPGNLTIDTIAQLSFAIKGYMVRLDLFDPMEGQLSNAVDTPLTRHQSYSSLTETSSKGTVISFATSATRSLLKKQVGGLDG